MEQIKERELLKTYVNQYAEQNQINYYREKTEELIDNRLEIVDQFPTTELIIKYRNEHFWRFGDTKQQTYLIEQNSKNDKVFVIFDDTILVNLIIALSNVNGERMFNRVKKIIYFGNLLNDLPNLTTLEELKTKTLWISNFFLNTDKCVLEFDQCYELFRNKLPLNPFKNKTKHLTTNLPKYLYGIYIDKEIQKPLFINYLHFFEGSYFKNVMNWLFAVDINKDITDMCTITYNDASFAYSAAIVRLNQRFNRLQDVLIKYAPVF